MKKLLAIAVLTLTVSACSTTKVADAEMSKEAIKYTQEFGKVEVTFNDKGDWETLKSSATASMPLSDDSALEQAMNLAAMRAKRNIVEFMNTDLRSSKTTETLTNALAKDVSADDAKSKERAGNIATKIQEKISVQSDGMLRGAYISDRKVSSDKTTVVVTLQIDKRSMLAASRIRSALSTQ